jgi:hypothetical protein
LKHGKVNFNLIEPTGMDRRVNRDNVFPSLDKPGIGSIPTMRRAVIHNPENPSRRTVRLLAHDLLNQPFKRFDPGFSFTSAENLRTVNVPGSKIGRRPFSFVFVFNAHHTTSLGRQGLCLSLPSLDAGLLVCRDDVIVRSERDALPNLLIQVQDRPCLDDKSRVAWKYPTTKLPRFDCISAQPSPNSDSTDTGDNALLQNVSSQLSETETRQGNTEPRREFACQSFNSHHYPGGKTGQAARIWAGQAIPEYVFQRTSFAICSRFVEEYHILRQFHHLISLVQLTRLFWHATRKSTVPYTYVPFAQALPFHLTSTRSNTGFSLACSPPFQEEVTDHLLCRWSVT